MVKKQKKRAFWNSIKFKYKLTIINENTLEEIVGIRVSKLNGISVLLTTFFLSFTITAIIIAFTPLRNYLPGYMNSEIRKQVVVNALRADSLQMALEKQKLYVMNIQNILSGKIDIDSVQSIDSLTNLRRDSLMGRTQQEETFCKQYEETEKYNLTAMEDDQTVNGLMFFRPTQGMISSPFDANKRHFGTDIAAKSDESVVAVLDGTVILSTYTAETGYVIGLQHTQSLITFYKHCGLLLKTEGDVVKAGEAIALVGNTGTLTTEPHLHFELWRKGKPINPEKYIIF